MHVAIIFNPNSTGDSEKNARELASTVRKDKRYKVDVMPTHHAGHAQELARDYALKHTDSIVMSSSGDGGYNEVVNGLMEAIEQGANPIAAVIPSGNANDHDRAVRDNTLTEAVLRCQPRPMDLLEVASTAADGTRSVRFAHSYIGLGLTPAVAVELNKHNLNALREMMVLARSFAAFEPLTITLNGRDRLIDSLIISNIGGMAKVLKLAQRSAFDDGLFEVNVFPHGHKARLILKLLRGATFGLHASKRTNAYDFAVTKAIPIQLDGEIVKLAKNTKVHVACRKHAIRTLA